MLPIKVNPDKKKNVLIVVSFPSFELRYLKNYLAELGYGVAVDIHTSQDLNAREFINIQEMRLQNLGSELLSSFDLLIVDSDAFGSLKNTEKWHIKTQLTKGKLGLLFLDANAKIEAVRAPVKDFRQFEGENGALEIQLQDYLPVEQNGNIKVTNELIGTYFIEGIGIRSFLGLKNTYQLLLKGEQKLYAQIWNELITRSLGYGNKNRSLQLPVLARVGYPETIRFFSSSDTPELYVDKIKIPPAEYPLRPGYFNAAFWPTRTGWHEMMLLPDSTNDFFYVQDEKSWKTFYVNKKQIANALTVSTVENSPPIKKMIQVPISRWWFFGLFLVSAGFLWLEQRVVG
jgi:hypothetical protein